MDFAYLRRWKLIATFLLFTQLVTAQINPTSKNHYHDFDFWIGTWEVYKYGTDTLVGLSEIKPILGHTAIEENYQGWNNSFRGTSHNVFNAAKGRWEQYWVDNGGLTLHIKGGLKEGKMVLTNCENENCNKIIWTPLDEGEVRQEWWVSKNNGIDWQVAFDGHYKSSEKTTGVQSTLAHIMQYPNVRDFTISNDGKEAYITIQNLTEERRVICRMEKKYGIWSTPRPASFSGQFKDLEPYFSPDNRRLYFVSNRPNSFEKENYDIYYVERLHRDSSWSQPINLGSPVNTAGNEFYPAVASSGNIYFTCVKAKDKGRDDIYFSAAFDGQYQEPESLDSTINTSGYEFNCYVSPDESYLIFSGYNREDGLGSGDLYISHKKENGTWAEAQNMGPEVNSKYMDYCPFVDIQSRRLYFTSRRTLLNSDPIRTNFKLEREILKYQNGISRIYDVKFKP